jgi:hypothetical protein
MSLLDSVRQTLTDVADSVVEQSRSLGNQGQLQLQIKKLQLERAKRIHELGKQTFGWYQSGSLSVSGPVPPGLLDVCRALDDVERQLADSERQLEEIKQQAAQQAQPNLTVTTTVVSPDPNGATATPSASATPTYAPPQSAPYSPPPAAPYAPPPAPAPPAYGTTVLPSDPANASHPPHPHSGQTPPPGGNPGSWPS